MARASRPRRSSSRRSAARERTRSTWSFFKLWRFALDGLFSFSTAPLKLWTYIGALSALGAFIYLVITLIQKLFFGIAAPGYASLLIVVLFFNGLLLLCNGIQGEYIARIFEEVKGRPLFVVGQRSVRFDGRREAPEVVDAEPPTSPPTRAAEADEASGAAASVIATAAGRTGLDRHREARVRQRADCSRRRGSSRCTPSR